MATMMRWNPMREMMAMQNMLDAARAEARTATPATASLPLDVKETDGAYTVTATLPGVAPEAINISFHDGVLTIAAETTKTEQTEDNARALLTERRSYSKVSRAIRLPVTINMESAEAVSTNGVLTLTLPKSEAAQPKLIPVRTATATTHSQN